MNQTVCAKSQRADPRRKVNPAQGPLRGLGVPCQNHPQSRRGLGVPRRTAMSACAKSQQAERARAKSQ